MGIIKAVLSQFAGAVQSDLVSNAMRDLKSTRSLWCWLYLGLYVWISVWALRHRPQAAQTVVSVTGGLASSIFLGYVFSRTYEKRHKIGTYAPPPGPPNTIRGAQP